MLLTLFMISMVVCSLVLHFNRVPLTPLMLFIVVAISAIPVLNCLVLVVGVAELVMLAYNYNQQRRNRFGGF